jgi:hypothetical protein
LERRIAPQTDDHWRIRARNRALDFLSLADRIKPSMRRPTLIVAEPEPGQALSTRKLVLETAKLNVLTAHSTEEALEVFQSFPNTGCLIAVEGETADCERILKFVRTIRDDIPLVALSPRHAFRYKSADHNLSSHDPEALVQLMRSLLGDPRQIDPAIHLQTET